MSARIPVTIVTGFLGAGKTTLIRTVVEGVTGTRVAFIINEFGDMGFDGSLVEDCVDPSCQGGVVELTNGCLCCTVADDFVPALEALLSRDAPPDRIVIETSGLAMPQPLIAAFNWPSVKPRVTVDAVITVVDAPAVLDGRFAHDPDAVAQARAADDALDHESPLEELFEDQLRAADLVVLSKTDSLDEAAHTRVTEMVSKEVREGVAIIPSARAEIFGLGAEAEADIAARKGHHDHDDAHEHDDFEGLVIPAQFKDRAGAEAAVAALARDPAILRVKGTVAIADRPAPLYVQAVGPRVETWFGRPGAKASALVVIGLKPLPTSAISALSLAQAA
ncbi:MAG: cobalamin biosynthesis protein CobW [Pseudomonadota bacterium]